MQSLTTALSTLKPESSADFAPAPLTSRQQAAIGTVLDRLSGQLGTKMADLFAGANPATVQAEWASGLAGYRRAEIERGIAACRTRAFAPTLGEFLRLCRPALDPEWAWYEAGRGLRERDAGRIGDWSHPAVWRAACTMSMEVRSGDHGKHRKRWAFELECEMAAGWGEEVPEPLLRIEADVRGGPPSAEVRERLAALSRRASA